MSVVVHPRGTQVLDRRAGHSVGRRIRRAGLAIFFVSVAVNAALGIYAVLAPDFGDTQARIVGTSLCVTGATLVALACEPAWERRLLGPVPYVGSVLGVVAFGLAVVGMWSGIESDTYGKAMGTTFVAAAAFTAASLLALARLAKRHGWVLALTLALLAIGATLLAIALWLDDPSEAYVRAMGVVLVALAAFAVTVPVLNWIDRGALAPTGPASDPVRFCPHCGAELGGETGVELACGRCGRGFVVTPRGST